MYDVSNPKKLLSKFVEGVGLSKVEGKAATLGGIEGKQYLKKGEGYFDSVRLYASKNHLYVLEAAARAKDNPRAALLFLADPRRLERGVIK
jgi:hypothetical protein